MLEENEKEVLITLDAADSLPSAVPDGQLVSVNGASEEQPTHVVLKTIKKLTVEVLCSQHNPVRFISLLGRRILTMGILAQNGGKA